MSVERRGLTLATWGLARRCCVSSVTASERLRDCSLPEPSTITNGRRSVPRANSGSTARVLRTEEAHSSGGR